MHRTLDRVYATANHNDVSTVPIAGLSTLIETKHLRIATEIREFSPEALHLGKLDGFERGLPQSTGVALDFVE